LSLESPLDFHQRIVRSCCKSTKKTKQNKLALEIGFQAFIHRLHQILVLFSSLFWLIQYFVLNAFLALARFAVHSLEYS
ncbi:MAG: hypothetical protein AAF806_26550, partial [Bacteroidota bacterium]